MTARSACPQNARQHVEPVNASIAANAVSAASAEDEFLTTDEVAKRLRVHPTTILRRLGSTNDADPDRIPAVRVGRVWRIPRREFEEWLGRSRQKPSGRQRRLF